MNRRQETKDWKLIFWTRVRINCMNFLLAVPALVWLLLSAVFHAGGEYFSKKWSLEPGVLVTLVAVLFYTLSSALWLPALLNKQQLAVTGMAWLALAMTSTVIIGVVIFREPVSVVQWIGIGLAAVAVILLGI